MDPAKGHVAQKGVVRLVLGWHEEKLTAFPELARIYSTGLNQEVKGLLGSGTRGRDAW